MIIGTDIEGKDIILDIQKLVATRLLIQANSGGGKSYILRKILEESHGKIQQIVIDLEGEFSTLREKYDYLLCGKGGEVPVNLKTAELLARKILELKVSTIIDISELKKHERTIFVKRFLDSLIDSPKKLWHSCMIVIDEVHYFCPQSSKSDSAASVIDLMTRGRKRGFCGVLATQRISKLHKDASAEANNHLIGRTNQDIDRKRAGEELGFTSKEDVRNLRNLEAGEFLGFGPSISKEIIKIKVGKVKTTHPDITKGISMKPCSTPSNIKKILKEVIDLPKEAENELKDKKDFLEKIKKQSYEIRVLKSQASKIKPILVDKPSLQKAKEQGYKEAEKNYKVVVNSIDKQYKLMIDRLEKVAYVLSSKINKFHQDCIPTIEILTSKKGVDVKIDTTKSIQKVPTHTKTINDPKWYKPIPQNEDSEINKNQESYICEDDKPLKSGAMKILGFVASKSPEGLSKQRVATLSGFSMKGGTFGGYLSKLRKKGWITTQGNKIFATEEGINNAKEIPEIPSGEELLILWSSRFKSGVGRMLKCLYDNYPEGLSRVELGETSGYESSGGTFGGYLSKLKKNDLVTIQGEMITISKEFFE